MSLSGFVTLDRRSTEWEWYKDLHVKAVFFHLILVANHAPSKWKGIDIQRGQRLTSIHHLASECGSTPQSVRTALKRLKSTGELTYESTSQYTLITLTNYDTYQSKGSESNKRSNKASNKQLTNDQQTTNNKQQEITIINKKKEIYIPRDSLGLVLLSDEEFNKLGIKYGNKLREGIERLSTWISQKKGQDKWFYKKYSGAFNYLNPSSCFVWEEKSVSRRQAGEDALERSKARTRAMRAEVEREKAERAKSGVIEVPSHVQTRPAELEYFDFWGEINDKKGE